MATESQFTISPSNRSAIASERAVLPLPVGPTIATSNGSALSGMPGKETAIANKDQNESEHDEDQDADRLHAQCFVQSLLRVAEWRSHIGIVPATFVG